MGIIPENRWISVIKVTFLTVKFSGDEKNIAI